MSAPGERLPQSRKWARRIVWLVVLWAAGVVTATLAAAVLRLVLRAVASAS